MVRVGLFSQDATLQSLLSSALGNEFEFILEARESQIGRLLSAEGCGVMILDLNSSQDKLGEQLDT
ncbi:MAG: sigma-54-dependent transcriptional regulator, partial [Terracidiphilus sp.]